MKRKGRPPKVRRGVRARAAAAAAAAAAMNIAPEVPLVVPAVTVPDQLFDCRDQLIEPCVTDQDLELILRDFNDRPSEFSCIPAPPPESMLGSGSFLPTEADLCFFS